jgi:hypothetical protein
LSILSVFCLALIIVGMKKTYEESIPGTMLEDAVMVWSP